MLYMQTRNTKQTQDILNNQIAASILLENGNLAWARHEKTWKCKYLTERGFAWNMFSLDHQPETALYSRGAMWLILIITEWSLIGGPSL